MEFKSLEELIYRIQRLSHNHKIYIWGIGVCGNLLGMIFNNNNIEWCGYYNNYENVGSEYLNGKPVYKGNRLDGGVDVVYVLTMRNYSVVKEQLISSGIKEEQIIFIDNVNILNCISASGGSAPSFEKIKSFYNIYEKQKCFIIGNGPSLSIEDLDRIYKANIKSFASNMIFKCYDKTKWRPNYYFSTDAAFIQDVLTNKETLEYVSQNCEYVFSRSNGALGEYAQKIRNLVLFKSMYSESEQSFEFSSDCSEKIIIGHTVSYAMIQMAVYMGFSQIYLLGMDHNFSLEMDKTGNILKRKDVRNHSAILGNDVMRGIANTELAIQAYMAAKEYADTHGVKIYNATHGGKLEVFERVDFDELF